MKKRIALLLAVVMLLALCACGAESTESETPEPEEQAHSYEKNGEMYYTSGDLTLHIDHVFIDTEKADISSSDDYKTYVFYSIDSEKTNKSEHSIGIRVNDANSYNDSYAYNYKWINRDILDGTKYEPTYDTLDPSKTLYGCGQFWISNYDKEHLSSFAITVSGFDTVDYPISKIKTVNGLSSANLK
ncbi:MAG: hypothetical protein IJS31_02040 [Oscillospiraceae bacterium]|nr:hypothetical protein [Oscillospiraceae bacterium]